MIPYAGWFPETSNTINVQRALVLYTRLKSWRAVGIELAKEEERGSPYQEYSVRNAVRRHRKTTG